MLASCLSRLEALLTGIAFIGTGFVADYYMTTLANHPQLRLTGAYDNSAEQLQRFSRFCGVRAYADLDEVLADPAVAIVVNLTDPESHYPISRAALEAGKHVYSEKPLAMRFDEIIDQMPNLIQVQFSRCMGIKHGCMVNMLPLPGQGSFYCQ